MFCPRPQRNHSGARKFVASSNKRFGQSGFSTRKHSGKLIKHKRFRTCSTPPPPSSSNHLTPCVVNVSSSHSHLLTPPLLLPPKHVLACYSHGTRLASLRDSLFWAGVGEQSWVGLGWVRTSSSPGGDAAMLANATQLKIMTPVPANTTASCNNLQKVVIRTLRPPPPPPTAPSKP